MTRQELYKAMEHEKIIMYEEFLAHLNRTPLAELVARWAGVLELAKEHEIRRNRADWIAMFFWNSTSLTVGEDELIRRMEARKRESQKREAEERKRKEQLIHDKLSTKKLRCWRFMSSADRKRLVEEFLPQTDEFYQEYVREHYLRKLDFMDDRTLLAWFWDAIPPFSLQEINALGSAA